MALYTKAGVKVGADKLHPWDRVRKIKLKDGDKCTRCELIIREGMKFDTPGLGPIQPNDLGKVLVVDMYEDGNKIDALDQDFSPSHIKEIELGGLQAALDNSAKLIKEAQAAHSEARAKLDEYINRNKK
jgi:hypothetical protein